MRSIVSIDLGSTYTKGALFTLDKGRLQVQSQEAVPTTPSRLADGFQRILAKLAPDRDASCEIVYSSSAKGGLSIAAVGIVPDLTSQMAYQTAVSAGARIHSLYSYKLTRDDVDGLKTASPDIVLLTGGMDGGNEEYLRHNARMLADMDAPPPVLFAGNRAMRDEIRAILKDRELYVTENVLPEIDRPNPAPARRKIQQLFLERIAKGKGLAPIIDQTKTEPTPTPLAILRLVEALTRSPSGFQDFCVIDVGGATTDVYSSHAASPEADVITRGLPEETIKRTVEGDLGMRVNASSVLEADQGLASEKLAQKGLDQGVAEEYARGLAASPDSLPKGAQERDCDALLAEICVRLSAERHAGFRDAVYTVDGKRQIQKGKDLRSVRRLVGTGGYLSRLSTPEILEEACYRRLSTDGRERLLPVRPRLFKDPNHLFPLIANLAATCPEEAVQLAADQIEELSRTSKRADTR